MGHGFFFVVGNYLRVRGEYSNPREPHRHQLELPPRARRIHNVFLCRQRHPGTTSACAENTGSYCSG